MNVFKKALSIIVLCITASFAFPGVGDEVPDITLYKYKDSTFTLYDHIEKKVILLITGSYC